MKVGVHRPECRLFSFKCQSSPSRLPSPNILCLESPFSFSCLLSPLQFGRDVFMFCTYCHDARLFGYTSPGPPEPLSTSLPWPHHPGSKYHSISSLLVKPQCLLFPCWIKSKYLTLVLGALQPGCLCLSLSPPLYIFFIINRQSNTPGLIRLPLSLCDSSKPSATHALHVTFTG